MDTSTNTYTKTFSIDVERANYHSKCTKRRIKRLLIVLLLWTIVLVYIFTPLSKVNLRIKGNVYYTESELLKLSRINKGEYWWLVNTKNAQKVLASYEYLDNVKVTKSFLGVKITFTEIYPIAVKDNRYVMSNKQIINKDEYDLNNKIANLASFDYIEDEDLSTLIDKYQEVNLTVRDHFTKLEIVKSDIGNNEVYEYVKIYGYDDKIGNYIIKVDLVYLNTKFTGNKYSKIVEEISKNNVKYNEEKPALIAYHNLDESEFNLVESFEEE